MAARIVELCDLLADFIGANINGNPYDFTLRRAHPAFVNLEESPYTNVFVYPGTMTRAAITREAYQRDYLVFVHITNYIDTTSQDEINSAIELAEVMEDGLQDVALGEFEMWTFQAEFEGRAPFEIESTTKRNFFHLPIGIVYRAIL